MSSAMIVAAIALITAAPSNAAVYSPRTAAPGYLTIQFGRSIWTAANNCQPVAGALTLLQIAQDLQARSLTGTGTVVVDRTNTTGRLCTPGYLYSNWSDLTTLKTTYGWQFVSDGLTHNDITKMTPPQQYQESCGSLPSFISHGFNSAWGLFAYGDNHFTNAIQTYPVKTCFAYGRTYRGGTNFRASMKSPWFQNTNSVTGGACNMRGLPCYSINTKHYNSPITLAQLVSLEGPDQWVDIQFYRLVSGSSNQSSTWSWDCTSPNWMLHWTSQTELYCQNDFDNIFSHVPAGITVTDPATVATAWGRSPG